MNTASPIYREFIELGLQGNLEKFEEKKNRKKNSLFSSLELAYLYYTALIDFGHVDKAFKYCETILSTAKTDHTFFVTFQFKYKVFSLLSDGQEAIDSHLRYFETCIDQAGLTTFNRAVVCECLSNVIGKGISIGQLGALEKKKRIEWREAAISYYQEVGATFEYFRARIQLALLLKDAPFKDMERVKKILRELVKEAAEPPFGLLAAKCELLLAELHFIEIHKEVLTQDKLNEGLQLFDAVEQKYRELGHVMGKTIVDEKRAGLLLEYAYPEGLPLMREVVQVYHQYQLHQYEVVLLRKMTNWYLLKGDLEQYSKIELEIASVKTTFGRTLSEFANDLSEMELAGRNGDLEQARLLYLEAKEKYGDKLFFRQFNAIRATQLQQVGLDEKSLSLRRQQVELLEPLVVSSFLADAYIHLAMSLDRVRPREAIAWSLKALDIQDQLEDWYAAISTIRFIMDTLINEQRLQQPVVEFNTALKAAIDEGYQRLEKRHSLKGWKALGELLQTIGQLYFMTFDMDNCRKYFEEAEKIFTHYGLEGNLNFLYSQQGTSLIKLARDQRDINYYQQAIAVFEKAKKFAKQIAYAEQQRRIVWLQGICYYEIGQKTADPLEQLDCWKKAECRFEDAYQIAGEQRDRLDRSSDQNRQEAIIAFAKVYQEICKQGFLMNVYWAKRLAQAFMWLERMKAQSLVDVFRYRVENVVLPAERLLEQQLKNDQTIYQRLVRQLAS